MPNCVIVGAPKAGTSSLFRWLVDHPQVDGSLEKETYYFVDPGTHVFRRDRNFASCGLRGYEAIFAHCDPSARVLLEATPSYMYSEAALRELPRLPTQPNLLIVLREPVAQVRSVHRYFQQNKNSVPRSMSFAEFVEVVESERSDFRGNELAAKALSNADYLGHLRRWREACGPGRLHIMLFEDLVENPKNFMTKLAETLGIAPAFYATYRFPVENETYVVRSGSLQELNIRLRKLITKGRAYYVLRSLYRALNTRRVPKVTSGPRPEDAAAERRLAVRYLATLGELEAEFALDLSRWRQELECLAEPAAGTLP